MIINHDALEEALATIREDEEGYLYTGRFGKLLLYLHPGYTLVEKPSSLYPLLTYAFHDLQNLLTICLRLEWQKNLWSQGNLDEGLWFKFCRSDIDLFHIEFRSLFDYLAQTITKIAKEPSQLPLDGSYRELRQWALKASDNRKSRALGDEFAELICRHDWFDNLREVRDSIIHDGGFTVPIFEKNKLLFQIYEGFNRKILIKEVMENENTVDFSLYAGLHVGYLIGYLENFSEITCNSLNIKAGEHTPRNYHPGLKIITEWIKLFQQKHHH